MELGTGAPSVQGDVTDFSSFSAGVLKGVPIVFGITERGEPGVPKFVQSDSDYAKYFGGLIAGTSFPYLMQDAIGRGFRGYIIPAGHYTDVADKTSLTGTKGTATLTGSGSDTGDDAAFEASSAGPWSDDLSITTTDAANGDVNAVDIKISLAKYTSYDIKIPAFPKVPTADEKAVLNSKIKNFCQLGVITTSIPSNATVNFSGGVRSVGAILTADYIGDAGAGTGIYAAKQIKDAVRIAVPEIAAGLLDIALADYCNARKDMIHMMRSPIDLDADTLIDYREGQGAYNWAAIDSWRTLGFTGGLKTIDKNGTDQEHSELASVLVNYQRKDSAKSANFSAAGLKRGVIENAKGPVRDFGDASMATDFGRIYQRGWNAIVNDYDPDQNGNVTKIEGNRTMWKKPSLLQKANIAEYLVWLFRMISPLVKLDGQYEPNDPIMWQGLYQKIAPILKDSKNKMRAIYDWAYIGDQFANTIDDVKFNSKDDLNAGIYKFRPLVKPIASAEWIGFEIGVTNAGVSFEDFTTANL